MGAVVVLVLHPGIQGAWALDNNNSNRVKLLPISRISTARLRLRILGRRRVSLGELRSKPTRNHRDFLKLMVAVLVDFLLSSACLAAGFLYST